MTIKKTVKVIKLHSLKGSLKLNWSAKRMELMSLKNQFNSLRKNLTMVVIQILFPRMY